MNKLNYKSTLSICIISAFAMTGCATSTLLKKDNGVRTRNVQTVLVNDTVLAFGKPSQAISALPSDCIVSGSF